MSSDVLFTPATNHRLAHQWRPPVGVVNGSRADRRHAEGCCRRLTLTDLDRQGRDKVIQGAGAGMSVTIDKIGNVFMRREGRNPGLPPIVSGSHIDTQPTGGKFDGNYGVLAALEVVRTLNDLQIDTDAPIEVVFWTNEEGSRCTGDDGLRVFAGVFPLEETWPSRIKRVSASARRWRRSYIGEQTRERAIGAYFEAHIEQGPILEDEAKTIGIVQGVLGIRWYDCVVTGQPRTPDPRRCACVRMLQWRPALCRKWWPLPGVKRTRHRRQRAGVAQQPQRGARGGHLLHDMRNLSDALVDEMDRQLRAFIAEVERESGLQVA